MDWVLDSWVVRVVDHSFNLSVILAAQFIFLRSCLSSFHLVQKNRLSRASNALTVNLFLVERRVVLKKKSNREINMNS